VTDGTLLALYRDDTGRFNEMHRSLIHELHLEIPLGREDFQNMLGQLRASASAETKALQEDAHGSIGGLVRDEQGKPRSGARVHIRPLQPGFEQICVTNPSGRFFVAHVPTGTYELCAGTWDGKTAAQGCTRTSIKSGEVLTSDLRLKAVRNEH